MAQINQLGSVPIAPLLTPVWNYTGTDIQDGRAVILDTANPGGSNLGRGVTLPAGSAKPFGIASGTIPAGKAGLVSEGGIAVGYASGTLHVGDTVMTAADGSVLLQTTGLPQLGTARSEAVSGDRVQVHIAIAKNS